MKNKIDMFLISNSKYLPAEKMVFIQEKLQELDEGSFDLLFTINFNDPMTVLLISLLCGSFGIDRFVIGDIGLGVLKLCTCGCCGIFTIIDWFTIRNRVKEVNYNKLMAILC